jgi:hypothetical protein
MVSTIREHTTQYLIEDGVPLPAPLPDIDLLAVDDSSSTIVVAELKWIRKTLRSQEFKDRDREVTKGIAQLKSIKGCLEAHPAHLQSLSPEGVGVVKFLVVWMSLIVVERSTKQHRGCLNVARFLPESVVV